MNNMNNNYNSEQKHIPRKSKADYILLLALL